MNCKFVDKNGYYECSVCGYQTRARRDPSKIFRECSKEKTVRTEPSLLEKATNFAGSMVEYAQSGFENVSDEEHKRRMDICQGTDSSEKCEFFENGTCQKCGCSCNFKSRMKAMKCPIGKW